MNANRNTESVTRLPTQWYCDLHDMVHAGQLTDWSMDHREHLHPVYFHDRRLA